jgi:NitT/TauT family transport system ATP-binding protein
MPASAKIRLANIGIVFRPRDRGAVEAVRGVSLDVPDGAIVSIVGPSGCGKTTLLHLCCGLEPMQSGRIAVGGQSHPAVGLPGTAYVPATPALLPWRTALLNVEVGLEMVIPSRTARRARARAALEMVGLKEFESSHRAQLSQGMRQRVGLARAVAREPELYYMDEPFAALDAQTRLILQGELMHLLELRPATVLFVTHDLGEAVALADRVIVMSARPGRIVADYEIDLPRPRDPLALQSDPGFDRVRAGLWEVLRDQIAASRAAAPGQ